MTSILRDHQLGELSYAGWRFDSFHHSRVSCRVILDDAGRIPKWQEVSIQVEADVDLTQFPDMDVAVNNLWTALSTPGGTLTYSGKGFGPFSVNAGNLYRDVNWGPKPELIEFVPVGANNVVHVVWRVTAYVACPDKPGTNPNHLFNFSFEVTYDLDSDSYLTLSISGAYEIPATYSTNLGTAGPLNVTASADTWWGDVCPQTPAGFQYVTKTRKVSRDRRRVDFNMVYKEMPVPLPPDCTMMEAKHRVKNTRPKIFAIWTSTISGTVRVNPRLPRSAAWDRFTLLLFSRIKWARTFVAPPAVIPGGAGGGAGGGPGFGAGVAAGIFSIFGGGLANGALAPVTNNGAPPVVTGAPRAGGVILVDIDFEEDVFGRESRFSCTYSILNGALERILRQSGLWLPVPGTSHAIWKDSMDRGQINNPYGRRKNRFEPNSDVMVDLCSGPPAEQFSTTVLPPLLQSIPNPQFDPTHSPANAGGNGQLYFSPESSWLAYDADIFFSEDDNVIRHKPLAGNVTQKNPKANINAGVGPILTATYQELLLTDWDQEDILQRVCSPDTSVVLQGTAMRLGYRMTAPRLEQAGGKAVTQLTAVVREKRLGDIQGIPVWGLAWRIEYALTEPAAALPTLANPLLVANGSDRGGSLNLMTGLSKP